ncbi:hypothetical protein ACWF95_37420 [Streptomyces vinaceus]
MASDYAPYTAKPFKRRFIKKSELTPVSEATKQQVRALLDDGNIDRIIAADRAQLEGRRDDINERAAHLAAPLKDWANGVVNQARGLVEDRRTRVPLDAGAAGVELALGRADHDGWDRDERCEAELNLLDMVAKLDGNIDRADQAVKDYQGHMWTKYEIRRNKKTLLERFLPKRLVASDLFGTKRSGLAAAGVGAGAGAVAGFLISSGTGPGVIIGAIIGAVLGFLAGGAVGGAFQRAHKARQERYDETAELFTMAQRLDALAGRLGELKGVMNNASAVGKKYIRALPVVRSILDALDQQKNPDLSKHPDEALNDAEDLLEAGVQKTAGAQKEASKKIMGVFSKSKTKAKAIGSLAAQVLHVFSFVKSEKDRRRKPPEGAIKSD